MIPPYEEGETRTGCFSSSDDSDIHYGLDIPMCPVCGSRDYQLLDEKTAKKCHCNVRCANCGRNYNFNFNK